MEKTENRNRVNFYFKVNQIDITNEIDIRIGAFKKCLIEHGCERALSEYLMAHGCSIIGSATEGSLRRAIADEFSIDMQYVTLVGSAKLGFSPKPGQYFKHFSANSDLDVAIVSKELFLKVWTEVFEMERAGEYYDFNKFKHYHYRGWIRPDKLPPGTEYRTCKDWWEFFHKLSNEESYSRLKVRAGLYFDEYFLRCYQMGALNSMQENLILRERNENIGN